jgi:hypothetical protein
MGLRRLRRLLLVLGILPHLLDQSTFRLRQTNIVMAGFDQVRPGHPVCAA